MALKILAVLIALLILNWPIYLYKDSTYNIWHVCRKEGIYG